ncbi:hypothetical protein AAZX31_10G233500 [Glycine max]
MEILHPICIVKAHWCPMTFLDAPATVLQPMKILLDFCFCDPIIHCIILLSLFDLIL